MNPGRTVKSSRGRLTQTQGLDGVGHGVAVLAQCRQSQAPAEVGVGIRGVEPDGLLEVTQCRPRRVGNQIKRTATA